MSDGISDKMSLADKLYRTKYEPDAAHPHIVVDQAICAQCKEKVCLVICPAEVYKADPNHPNQVTVSHENCLECGTCRKACPFDGIRWLYPEGGKGVKYRFG